MKLTGGAAITVAVATIVLGGCQAGTQTGTVEATSYAAPRVEGPGILRWKPQWVRLCPKGEKCITIDAGGTWIPEAKNIAYDTHASREACESTLGLRKQIAAELGEGIGVAIGCEPVENAPKVGWLMSGGMTMTWELGACSPEHAGQIETMKGGPEGWKRYVECTRGTPPTGRMVISADLEDAGAAEHRYHTRRDCEKMLRVMENPKAVGLFWAEMGKAWMGEEMAGGIERVMEQAEVDVQASCHPTG